MKILVIDDDENIRESISELLETKEYTTITARNGQEGVQLAREFRPDLILCDVMMPNMDGHEVLNHIRNIDDLTMTPFIFLTAKSQKEDVRYGMNLGADDYLTKPFRAKELFDTVEVRLARKNIINSAKIKVLDPLRKKIITQGLLDPIQGLINSSELFLKYFEDYSKEEVIGYAENVRNSSKKIERAAKNTILSQSIKLAQYDNEVKDSLVKGTIENCEETIRKAAISIGKAYDRESDIFFKHIDNLNLNIPTEIFKVIINEVIINAFQYSKNGLIGIETTIIDCNYQISVSNSAQQLSSEMLDKLGLSL